MICNDEGLAALDRKLADVYGIAAKTPSQYDDLNLRQRNWIRTRDSCWQDTIFTHASSVLTSPIADCRRVTSSSRKEPYAYTCPGASRRARRDLLSDRSSFRDSR
jgi:uncharacterized protein